MPEPYSMQTEVHRLIHDLERLATRLAVPKAKSAVSRAIAELVMADRLECAAPTPDTDCARDWVQRWLGADAVAYVAEARVLRDLFPSELGLRCAMWTNFERAWKAQHPQCPIPGPSTPLHRLVGLKSEHFHSAGELIHE